MTDSFEKSERRLRVLRNAARDRSRFAQQPKLDPAVEEVEVEQPKLTYGQQVYLLLAKAAVGETQIEITTHRK